MSIQLAEASLPTTMLLPQKQNVLDGQIPPSNNAPFYSIIATGIIVAVGLAPATCTFIPSSRACNWISIICPLALLSCAGWEIFEPPSPKGEGFLLQHY